MSNIWAESEGDQWFLRNKDHLGEKPDLPLRLMDLYDIKPATVLEVGAANGWRLARIHERCGSQVTALEPSRTAIHDGRARFPYMSFIEGTCELSNIESTFDLVIVNFVFHWIPRDALYTCLQKIDAAVCEGGHLIVGDFGTDCFIKREYHHLKNAGLYTWKAPYWQLFLQSGMYLELARIRFNHDTGALSGDVDLNNMGTTSLLRKQRMYLEL